MKKLIQYGVWIVIPLMLFANIFIFISGMLLGNQINHFEHETSTIHVQNIELNKQTSYIGSLEHAASVAASLDFVKRSTPIVLDNLRYALNR